MWTCSCGTIWSDEQEFCEFCNEEDFQSGICKVCNYKSFTLEEGVCHSCRIEENSFSGWEEYDDIFESSLTEEEHERKEELERARGEI
jgi:hypothetical protein